MIGPLGYGARALGDRRRCDLNARVHAAAAASSRPRRSSGSAARRELTDAGVRGAARGGAARASSERELGDAIERGVRRRAARTTHIHYLGRDADGRAASSACRRSGRATAALRAGDALVCEVSASFWEYPAQLLRTFTVDAEPTPLYRELHDVADAAFDAVVGAAARRARPRPSSSRPQA